MFLEFFFSFINSDNVFLLGFDSRFLYYKCCLDKWNFAYEANFA